MADAASSPQRRFSLAHLILVVPWVALVIDAFAPIRDNSFLWHVRAGSLQLISGSVLTEDPFSYTAGGEAWLTQSWLVELIYARLESLSVLGYVPYMMLAVTGLTFFGIGLIAYRASQSVLSTGLVLLLSTVSLISFLVPRPVLFSYLLFVLVIMGWESHRVRWTLPFLFWIWASVHGSFFIGLAYIGLRLISRKEWRGFPTAFGCGLVTLLTAHGLAVSTILLDFVAARPYLGLLSEWRTPELLSVVFFPFFVGVVIILFGATRGRIKSSDLVLIVPFLAMALSALRSVPPAFLALLVPIAASLPLLGSSLPLRFSRFAAGAFAVVVAVAPFLIRADAGLAEGRFPLGAVSAIENTPLFHNDVVGGYLIWERGPEFRVFIDDRAELYQDRIEQFVDIRSGREPWGPVFDEYGITQALLTTDEPMVGWLADAGWDQVYGDEDYVVLRRGAG